MPPVDENVRPEWSVWHAGVHAQSTLLSSLAVIDFWLLCNSMKDKARLLLLLKLCFWISLGQEKARDVSLCC